MCQMSQDRVRVNVWINLNSHLLLCALDVLNLAKLTKVGERVLDLGDCFVCDQQCRGLLLTDLEGFHGCRFWKWFCRTYVLCMMWSACECLQIGRNLSIFWSLITWFRLNALRKQTFIVICLLSRWRAVRVSWRGVRRTLTAWSSRRVVERGLSEVVAHGVLDFLCKSNKKRV